MRRESLHSQIHFPGAPNPQRKDPQMDFLEFLMGLASLAFIVGAFLTGLVIAFINMLRR